LRRPSDFEGFNIGGLSVAGEIAVRTVDHGQAGFL
jgi:hypothetical protein